MMAKPDQRSVASQKCAPSRIGITAPATKTQTPSSVSMRTPKARGSLGAVWVACNFIPQRRLRRSSLHVPLK
jgi:hypothetical protein